MKKCIDPSNDPSLALQQLGRMKMKKYTILKNNIKNKKLYNKDN